MNAIPEPWILPVTSSTVDRTSEENCPLEGGQWVEVSKVDQGFFYQFEPGALAHARYLTCDVLLDGKVAGVYAVTLQEGASGPQYLCHFAFLPQCQARIRLPLDSVDQNRWLFPREGAWLKVIVQGDRVDLNKVDRASFVCYRQGPERLRWCMSPLTAVTQKPPRLEKPLLPMGPLLDAWGQSTLSDWQGKTPNEESLVKRLQQQLADVDLSAWPDAFSAYGGARELRFKATGFFRSHHDGRRWWLVDPEGHAFWSAGLDCVRSTIGTNISDLKDALEWSPEGKPGFEAAVGERNGAMEVDFFRSNLIRAFGPEQWKTNWEKLALADLKRFGFNTMANWSEWEVAQEAGFPYVRPLQWPVQGSELAPRIFRDFPDPYDPAFSTEAAAYAQQLEPTREDPALLGYFLMNEPTWGFASMTPAEGMLFQTSGCEARNRLVDFLRKRYSLETLRESWGESVDFEKICRGRWQNPLTPQARKDLEDFSTLLVSELFTVLSEACRKVDPVHLNLGARYHRVPPDWALPGMKSFDVFSINCYRETVDPVLAEACEKLQMPALIGEWHFGALDVGLPASGIGRVASQEDRGKAFRVYTEHAAAQAWCVGVHYFTYADQSALGRSDGENYNIGFVDICLQPYAALRDAARKSHEGLYDVATGKQAPYDRKPEYYPRLFY